MSELLNCWLEFVGAGAGDDNSSVAGGGLEIVIVGKLIKMGAVISCSKPPTPPTLDEQQTFTLLRLIAFTPSLNESNDGDELEI